MVRARVSMLFLRVLLLALLAHGTPAVERCECSQDPLGRASIVLADGAAGSTWLGQMLDQHQCSSSFVVQSSRLDGKVYVNNIGELSALLAKNKRVVSGGARSKPLVVSDGASSSSSSSNLTTAGMQQQQQRSSRGYGLIVAWQSVEKLLKRHQPPQRHHLPLPPVFTVVVLLRDPFFWVLSQQKKLTLREDMNRRRHASTSSTSVSPSSSGVECVNIHQRGTKLCPIDSAYKFSLDPRVLDLRLREFEARTELMRSVGAQAVLKWSWSSDTTSTATSSSSLASSSGGGGGGGGSSVSDSVSTYLELDYAELMCAEEALGQKDALPNYLTAAMGLGTCSTTATASTAAASTVPEQLSRRRRLAHRLKKRPRRPPPPSQSSQPPTSPEGTTTLQQPQTSNGRNPHLSPPLSSSSSSVSAVKTSPSSPAAELENLPALVHWATLHRAPWLQRLSLARETALLNCSAAAKLKPPNSPAHHRPTLSSVPAAQPQQQQKEEKEGGSRAGSTAPSKMSPQGIDLAALASPTRMAHYSVELKRLHEAYLDLAEKLPHH